MAGTEYVIGSRITTEVDFRVGGSAQDPVTVRCLVKAPGSEAFTVEYPADDMDRLDVGVYRYEFSLGVVGPWAVRWEGSGDVEGVVEDTFQCTPSSVL